MTARSQSEPIFTWVTSSASIQSSQNSRYGSPARSPNSFIVVKTSIARPSSARLTPAKRSTGSLLQAAANSTVFSAYWPISVPIQSLSLTLISTCRASSQHCRAMSSFSANGTSISPLSSVAAPVLATPAVSKSKQVRPAPSSAWISPTKMPCMRPRAPSLASRRDGVSRNEVRLPAPPSLTSSAVRASWKRSCIVMVAKRSSRASWSTGRNLRMSFRLSSLTAYWLPMEPGPAMPPASTMIDSSFCW